MLHHLAAETPRPLPIELRAVRGRPLVLAALYLMLGIGIGSLLGRPHRWWALGIALGLLPLCLVCHARRRSPLLPAMAFAVVAGITLLTFALPVWADDPWAPTEEGLVRGRVVAVGWTEAGHAKYTIDHVTMGGQAIAGRVLLTAVDDSAKGAEGDWLTTQVGLARPETSRYFGDFNARGYYMRQGVRFVAYGAAPRFENGGSPGFFARARAYAREILQRNLGMESAGLVDALLTGSGNGISEEGRNAFGALGLAHLLAVSGLNVSLTAGAAWLLCRKLRFPLPVSLLLSFMTLFAYVLFAGPAPSLLRAAVMWVVMMGAMLTARRYDTITALGATAILLLVLNPLDLFDAGFQLSFAATAAIVLWAGPALRLLPQQRGVQRFAGGVGITVFVQLFALPLVLWYFGGLSLVSPLANLVLVPTSFILQMGGIALLAVGWLPAVAAKVGAFVNWCGSFYMGMVERLAQTPVTLHAAAPQPWFMAAFGLLALALCPALVRLSVPLRRVAAGLLAGLMLAQFSPWPARWCEPGDCVVLHEGGAQISVVWRDGAGWHVACADTWEIASGYLAKRGVTRVASLTLTDSKPPVGLAPFSSADGLAIDRIFVPDDWLVGDHGRVLRAMVEDDLALTPASRGPCAFTQWDGAAALTIETGGLRVRYLSYALKKSHDTLRPTLGDADVEVLNLGRTQLEDLLQGARISTFVTPSAVAGAEGFVYNISDCGSIAVTNRGGMQLTPWRGRWADGLQGNFR